MQTNDQVIFMFEQLSSQFQVVVEAVHAMQETMKTLATKEALQEVADDVETIKFVLTDTNKDVASLDKRVAQNA